ncbi:MAG: aspartate kinase, partial [Vicinamibacterales bacterium]
MKPALEVWKFGGASLADEHAIQRAATQIAGHRGPLVVVASALAGVTDLLLSGAHAAVAGDSATATRAANTFRNKHHTVARAIASGTRRERLMTSIDDATREYANLCKALEMLGHLEPRAQDLLVSRGERISAALLAAARGAVFVDALDVVVTDGAHGGAAPDLPRTAQQARRILGPVIASGKVAVVPGFIGRAPDGSLTTLGRGGSDLTATLLARSLRARTVVFWKDVPGILTADPRLVPDARVIPHLHHREAAEVAHYGAKVLHPRALIPVSGTRIALRIRSFVDTNLPGTEVSARQSLKGYPVKALAILPAQVVVTV